MNAPRISIFFNYIFHLYCVLGAALWKMYTRLNSSDLVPVYLHFHRIENETLEVAAWCGISNKPLCFYPECGVLCVQESPWEIKESHANLFYFEKSWNVVMTESKERMCI